MHQYGSGPLVQEYNHLHTVLADGNNHFGVYSLAFDHHEELLWMGNQEGHVTSYYGSELQKYTSFQVHGTNEIRQLLTVDVGLLALTSNSLRLSARRGLTIFNYSSESMLDMQCMTLLPSGNLLMGGHQPHLVELDLSRNEEVRTVEVGEQGCAIVRQHPRFVCCADISGKLTLIDPNTLHSEHILQTHSGMLLDFDVHGNLLVTSGLSTRQGALAADRFLMVFDLRAMRAVAPIQLIYPPFLVRFVSAFSSRLCVVSQTGQFQLLDTGTTQAPPFFHQIETRGAAVMSLDISSSCQAIAFGDAAGHVHLYSASSDQVSFNMYSQPTEFADAVEPLHPIDINDEVTPLSTVPAPYCEGKLLSDWPEEFTRVVYRIPEPIDPQLLESMRMVGSIGYAPNPGTRKRNQMPYVSNHKSWQAAKETTREEGVESVPQRYLKLEMKYTRMGMEEIDINLYNHSSFSGLDGTHPNAYANNIIQVLYFMEPLRCAILSHTCHREFCISCELGFLFHMLDTAQGIPCQASNFLRAFRTIPEASALGLILPDSEEAKRKISYVRLVQSWVRFVLQQIHSETVEVLATKDDESKKMCEKDVQSIVSRLFGAKQLICNRCKCGYTKEQESTTLLFSLVYPDMSQAPQQVSFTEVLQQSLVVEQSMPAWCDKCEKYQPMMQMKSLKSLPDILAINCGLDNAQDIKFWTTQIELLGQRGGGDSKCLSPLLPPTKKTCRYGKNCTRADCKFFHKRDQEKSLELENSGQQQVTWLPFAITISLDGKGNVCIRNCDGKLSKEEKERNASGDEPSTSEKEASSDVLFEEPYELMGIVSVVKDPVNASKDNIVSCIKVGPEQHARGQGSAVNQWYLFNHFAIVPVSKEEVMFMNFNWKLPCILFFTHKHLNDRHPRHVENPITAEVFYEDIDLASRGGHCHITFTPLSLDELPKEGDVVAMDAEFVTLNQEETEIRSDGTRSTIRPSQLSAARISCVRGDGPLEGVPFIDDYISTQEQVVDYLTKFSGIQPGDLDASISSKHLTTLKATYQKLRFLVDSGVKFVGHGLRNDFRVINLVVPPEQTIDTVLLFQLPNKRMVSLRFLAWHFLGINIQSETHDSVEDAKTALLLYRKYQELKKANRVLEALKEMYDMGRKLQWKVPDQTG